jgi:hypothetical protein
MSVERLPIYRRAYRRGLGARLSGHNRLTSERRNPMQKVIIRSDKVPQGLASTIDARDIALWLRDPPQLLPETLVAFLKLPWRLVICESIDNSIVRALEASEPTDSAVVRKRGFIHVVDGDPSRIEFPPQSLPLFLLNGRAGAPRNDFASRLRKINMLEMLRRASARQLLVVSETEPPIPDDLNDLWSSGFRAHVVFVSGFETASEHIQAWSEGTSGQLTATVITLPASTAVQNTVDGYLATYPDDRRILRVRHRDGTIVQLDITPLDDPERPILGAYTLLEERDVRPVAPADLGQEDFIAFFQDPESSWRPYAAGVPWWRDANVRGTLAKWLGKLETIGSEENFIAYISCEAGAGGTTLARALAWEFAKDGYPVLVANGSPFTPDAIPVRNFVKRIEESLPADTAQSNAGRQEAHRYEAPWILVFDEIHWRSRETELQQFRNEYAF